MVFAVHPLVYISASAPSHDQTAVTSSDAALGATEPTSPPPPAESIVVVGSLAQPAPPQAGDGTSEEAASWLIVLLTTQAYSLDMDPLWMAAPGERYLLILEEDGYVLAAWEEDAEVWYLWFEADVLYARG